MSKKLLALSALSAIAIASIAGHSCAKADADATTKPVWLEADSAAAIKSRTLSDFSLTTAEALEKIREKHPEVTDSDMRVFIEKHYVEAKIIDGVERIHNKSPRNLDLLNPAYNGDWELRGSSASERRISYVDSVLNWYNGKNPEGLAHEVVYRFTIDVPNDSALLGDTLSVWMPLPLETARQKDVKVISTYPENAQLAYQLTDDPEGPVHNSVYLRQAVGAAGDTTHFEAVISFETQGQYFAPKYILENIKPYDKNSELYRRYTAMEAPHIIRLDSLAKAIVGDETNPFKCSEAVFDYITGRYPWAGAREYSTISCIPEYVLREGHGDCGQVSLLYISLMRTLGIPARWESGWMLHPGEKNLHDWAEVYFEGIGWVPVDVSFGRYMSAKTEAARKFYSTGMDAHRLAANHGVCGDFIPAKKFVRSETVDFQLGEVECSQGNLFYPGWSRRLEIISINPKVIEK